MNFMESILSSEFIRAFGWTLLHSLWQGLIFFLIAIALLMFLRKNNPRIRYLMLYGLLILLPLVFVITFLSVYRANTGHSVTLPEAGIPEMTLFNGHQPVTQLPANDPTVPWFSHIVKWLDRSTQWLSLLWFAGFIILLVRFSGSLIYIYRIRNFNLGEVPEEWKRTLRKLSVRIGLQKVVRLSESSLVRIPVTAGYLKPVILLPVGTISGVPPQMVEAILLHELAHILRRDYLLNIIQSVIEIVFFYHPVTWWLSGQVRQEREHICDDIALGVSKDRINYIKALTTMEEKNVQSVPLVPALTGTRKKLLNRITRLAYPEKIRKSFMEGIIACIMLAGLVLGISANAVTSASDETSPGYLPTAYDLSGRESGDKVTNFLPVSFISQEVNSHSPSPVTDSRSADPDTIVAKSGSGKVMVMVYTDTIREGDEDALKDMVESFEESIQDSKGSDKMVGKKVVVVTGDDNDLAGLGKVVITKEGDSIKVISGGKTIVLPQDYDTTIVTDGGFQFYGFGNFPEIPEMPEIPDIKYLYHFDDDAVKWAEEAEKAQKEFKFQWEEMDRAREEMELQRKEMDKQVREKHIIVTPPDVPDTWHWEGQYPEIPSGKTEKIIRQELREDGLVSHGKSYIVEIGSKSMFINGEKQPKEVARKYMHLVEGLEQGMLDDNGTFRIVF